MIRVFYCIRLNPGTKRFWVEDTNTICYEQQHLVLVGAGGVPIMLFMCFGFPLFLFCMLYSNRNHLRSKNMLNNFCFLYKDYDEKAPYWEVLIYMRKAAIAVITVLGETLNVQVQGYLAIATLVVALLLQSEISPYTSLELNQLEVMSIGISIMVFIVAGLVQNMHEDPLGTTILSWLCVCVIAGYVLYIVCKVLPQIIHLLKGLQESFLVDALWSNIKEIPGWIRRYLLREQASN